MNRKSTIWKLTLDLQVSKSFKNYENGAHFKQVSKMPTFELRMQALPSTHFYYWLHQVFPGRTQLIVRKDIPSVVRVQVNKAPPIEYKLHSLVGYTTLEN